MSNEMIPIKEGRDWLVGDPVRHDLYGDGEVTSRDRINKDTVSLTVTPARFPSQSASATQESLISNGWVRLAPNPPLRQNEFGEWRQD